MATNQKTFGKYFALFKKLPLFYIIILFAIEMADPLSGGYWRREDEPKPVDVGDVDAFSDDAPLDSICKQHLQPLSCYKDSRFNSVAELCRSITGVIVIPTPLSLYDKHLVDRPIEEWKAAQLAIIRGRFEGTTTVFEDPGKFYFYRDLEVIVSHRKVKKYRVVPVKPRPGLRQMVRPDYPADWLSVRDQGLKFAIFDVIYHFNNEKDKRVKN